MSPRRIRLMPWGLLVLGGVYVVAGKLGLALAFVHASASPVWPPTGIALAATLLLGYRVWPGLFLGAFLVSVTRAGSGRPSGSPAATRSKGSSAPSWSSASRTVGESTIGGETSSRSRRSPAW